MFTSSRLVAAILLITAGSAVGQTLEQKREQCRFLAGAAGVIAEGGKQFVARRDVPELLSYISSKPAFDFEDTKSKLLEIVNQTDTRQNLTPAEYAGFTNFWCSWDASQIEIGRDVFDVQRQLILKYQTMLQ